MASYWMTEVIPMAATALLPVVLFPWLGIMDTKDVCSRYITVGYVIKYINIKYINTWSFCDLESVQGHSRSKQKTKESFVASAKR